MLRRLTTSETLGRSMSAWSSRLVPIAIVSVIFVVLVYVAAEVADWLFVDTEAFDVDEMVVFAILFGGLAFISALATPFIYGALEGRDITVKGAVRDLLRSAPSLLLTTTVIWLILVSMPLLVFMGATIGNTHNEDVENFAIFVTIVLTPIVPFTLGPVFWLAPAAAIIEKLPARKALARSAELTTGHRLRLIGIAIATWFTVFGLTILIALPFGHAELAPADQAYVNPVVVTVLLFFVYSLLGAVSAGVYHDLRLHREGITSDLIGEVFR